MDKHWSNFCTMSIVHFMAYPQCLKGEGPIAATVAKIAEDPFFTGIEIGWIKDPAERAKVKQIVDAAHIKVGYAGQSALLVPVTIGLMLLFTAFLAQPIISPTNALVTGYDFLIDEANAISATLRAYDRSAAATASGGKRCALYTG